MFLTLIELKIVQTESVAEEQRARLQTGRARPGTRRRSGHTAGIQRRCGKTIARILLGKKVVIRTAGAAPGVEEGAPTARYVMSGTDTVALVPEVLGAGRKPNRRPGCPGNWSGSSAPVRSAPRGPTASSGFAITRTSEATDWKLDSGDKPDNAKAQGRSGARCRR